MISGLIDNVWGKFKPLLLYIPFRMYIREPSRGDSWIALTQSGPAKESKPIFMCVLQTAQLSFNCSSSQPPRQEAFEKEKQHDNRDRYDHRACHQPRLRNLLPV